MSDMAKPSLIRWAHLVQMSPSRPAPQDREWVARNPSMKRKRRTIHKPTPC